MPKFIVCAVSTIALIFIGAPKAHAISAGERLVRAYPEFLSHVENNVLVWKDGTRMNLSDGRENKTPGEMIETPDLDDMVAVPYPKVRMIGVPASDPGRARYAPFFQKMYGDCTKNAVLAQLAAVKWLPEYGGGVVRVTRINDVDKKLSAALEDLAKLPAETIKNFLIPSAGGYKCRAIAGTNRQSAHGFGIAVDIGIGKSDYWRWSADGRYRNRIPFEIVEIFERHGFIWGGKWKSFDTMHFEYRPELLLD